MSSRCTGSAYDVIDRLARDGDARESGKRLAPISVYRALDFLVANNFAHRIESKNAYVACDRGRNASRARRCSSSAITRGGRRGILRRARPDRRHGNHDARLPAAPARARSARPVRALPGDVMRDTAMDRVQPVPAYLAAPLAWHVTVPVMVGNVKVGGGAPVAVQSMTNTDTADVEATVRQVAALARAGSEIVRITVDRDESAAAVPAHSRRPRRDATSASRSSAISTTSAPRC